MRKWVVTIVGLLFLPAVAFAAIGMDTASWTAGTGDQTIAFTAGSTSTVMFVGVINTNGVGDTVTGVTWNGSAMTLVKKKTDTGGSSPYWQYLFEILDPTTGNHNVVTTGASGAGVNVGIATYSGADDSGIVTNSTANSAISGSIVTATTTPSAVTSWIVGFGSQNNACTNTWSIAITKGRADDGCVARSWGDSNGVATTTGQVTARFGGSLSTDWNIIIAELKVQAAATPAKPSSGVIFFQ